MLLAIIFRVLFFFLFVLLPTQLGRHFWLRDSYVFGLKIDYLSPTLYLQDLLIFFLIFISLKKKYFRFDKKFGLLTTSYLLLAALNIVFSLTPLLSFFSWLRITEFILLGIIISRRFKKAYRHLLQILPFIVVFEFCLGLFQLVKQASLGGFFWFLGERTFNLLTPGIARGQWLGRVFLRPYGTFSHPNSLAGFILVSLILILGKKKLLLFDKMACLAGSLLIVLCFSRTVWLTVLVFGLCFILNRLLIGLRKKTSSLNFFYVFLLLLVIIVSFLFLRTKIEDSSISNRLQLAQTSLLMIKQNPLFGVGLNNFIISLSQKNTAWQWYYWLQPVHNVFLLIASETGLIGLIILIAFLIFTIRRVFQFHPPNRRIKFQIVIALLAIMFTGLFDHYWLTLIQNQLLLVVIFGLFWGENNEVKSDKIA
ncbi:hypothetical protein COT64_00335 [Candidatus Shapirobacteria bacterium CG09_land_8_20_14_0_10_39_12]|uniref:O-antigen ligase-related domain-containing protein n=1 Tax=Candidatus Shapirobacteria bacterium CG09_land_8_20_14_0_10_39_12 TaxID=1974885 RepID=A0A2H0WQF0_9BACT|nr:MAG: hypothetical protein COT64_00335 [Candidatus Shapirobacteria bacterium CG09_land_8_20_14_0_10_39_12]